MRTEERHTLVLSACRTALCRSSVPLISPTSITRSFTWGAKHKWNTNHHGKYLSEKIHKENNSKSCLRYPYFERQIFIRRFLPAQGWRSASHWRNSRAVWEKKDDSGHPSLDSQKDNGAEDWYTRWERQQREKFEALKKKIDQDPLGALFGKSNKWLGWTAETLKNGATKSGEQANVVKKKAEDFSKAKKVMKNNSYPMTMKGSEGLSNQGLSDHALISEKAEESEYEIDPITLRKVPKSTKPAAPLKGTVAKDTQKTSDIPVKTFKPAPRTTSMPVKGTSSTQVDDWLAREGFGSSQHASKPMSSSEYGTSVGPKMPASKIQTSLDRQLQDKSPDVKESDVTLEYDSKEKKDEDVDLLQPSDVRASVVKEGQPAKDLCLFHYACCQALEDRYERQQQWLEEERKRDEYHAYDVEFLRKKAAGGSSAEPTIGSEAIKAINDRYLEELSGISAHTGKPSSPYATSLSEIAKFGELSTFVDDNVRRIHSKMLPMKTQLSLMKAEFVALRQKWLEETRELKVKKAQEEAKLLETEIKAQKAAMEAAEVYRADGCMAPNVPEFASKKVVSPTKATKVYVLDHGGEGDLMYGADGCMAPIITEFASKKATKVYVLDHGGEGDLSPTVVQFASRDRWYKRKAPHANCEMDAKWQKLVKDEMLVREIRGIYEDMYGVIDTKHRQEELCGEGDMSPDVVNFASSDRCSKKKAPFNTGGFVLPEQKTGGNKGFTMLKEDPSAELLTKDAATTASSATSLPKAEQQPTPMLEKPAIPTATLQQITILKAQIDKQAAQLKKHRKEIHALHNNKTDAKPDHNKDSKPGTVRRVEPVFSGRTNKEKKRSSHRRKTFKHVLLTGFVTAACCYATGVAVELMKANGL